MNKQQVESLTAAGSKTALEKLAGEPGVWKALPALLLTSWWQRLITYSHALGLLLYV